MQVQIDGGSWETIDSYTSGDIAWGWDGNIPLPSTNNDYCFRAVDVSGQVSFVDCINVLRVM